VHSPRRSEKHVRHFDENFAKPLVAVSLSATNFENLQPITWLAGGKCQRSFDTKSATSPADRSQLSLLRERLAEHTVALRAVLDSAQADRELQPFDHAEAMMLLLGPVVLGMLTQSEYFDYHACADHAVQGFIAANRVRLPVERRRMS